jgi:hypothetical protein
MREECANFQTAATGQLNEVDRHLFAVYGQHDQSPVLTWLPILLGLLASAIVALAFCPVPRSQTAFRAGKLPTSGLLTTHPLHASPDARLLLIKSALPSSASCLESVLNLTAASCGLIPVEGRTHGA